MARLLRHGAGTRFGREHGLAPGLTAAAFRARVPVRRYEDIAPYIDAIFHAGARDVLWPGRVTRFAESSGTSGGHKRIPLPDDGVDWVYRRPGAQYMAHLLGRVDARRFVRGRTVFFVGGVRRPAHNPALLVGNITAVSVAEMRWYHDIFRAPDRATTLIANWEERLECMAARTMRQDIVHLAGMPTWIQRFGEIVLAVSGQPTLRAVWPNLQAMTIGGVTPAPYRAGLNRLVHGAPDDAPDLLLNEVFNATEGFYAAQLDGGDMALLPDAGIFHEFVPAEDARAGRFDHAVGLDAVELDREYAMVISTGVGLWRFLNGDTVRFTGRAPFRLRVAGRVSQFLNVSAEKLQVENADRAMADVCAALGVRLVDYTATALRWTDGRARAAHLWLVEIDGTCAPADFAQRLDNAVGRHCADYPRMRAAGAASGASFGLDAPLVLLLPRGYVARGLRQRYGAQLNAQSKLPRLSPEQDVARALLALLSADELARMTAHLPAAACAQIRAMAADQSRMAAM
ncbi:MAG: GH3 auxin-responsive promoter family protein [Caldilineaceae bacterium]|nr:GH3 auxin-responsive promoter family protein [Caldilineaceae bacterium]